MKTEIENAIKKLIEKISTNRGAPDEYLKITQSALNLAHTLNLIENLRK